MISCAITRGTPAIWLTSWALIGACSSFRPGTDVAPEVAHAWGCSVSAVQQRAVVLDSLLPAGKVYIPQVGWDACELLAHNGSPTRIELQQTADVRAANWWYQSEEVAHLVGLQLDPRTMRWFVTYVGW